MTTCHTSCSGGVRGWAQLGPTWHQRRQAVIHLYTKPVVSRSGHTKMKSNIFELCLVARVGRTQPSAICNSTRSLSGIRGSLWWAGLGNGGDKDAELFMGWGEMHIWRGTSWHERPACHLKPGWCRRLGYCQKKSSFKTLTQPRGICWLIFMAPIANEGHSEVSSVC